MQVKFQCKCKKVFVTTADNAGKRTKCSNCGAVLVIPQPAPAKPKALSVPPVSEGEMGLDGLNLSASGPLWTDEELSSPKLRVTESQPNPYQSPATLPQPVDRAESEENTVIATIKWLFSFNGRIPRSTYWAFQGIWIAIFVSSSLLNDNGLLPDVVLVVVVLLCLGPMIAIQVKRWHDLDKSGAYILVNFIPLVGGLIALVMLGAIAGADGRNGYGPDPRRRRR